MNCYSVWEMERANGGGDCAPVTVLARPVEEQRRKTMSHEFEVHTIDFRFSAPPLYAHFVRVDGGAYYQHVNPIKTHFLRPDFNAENDLHENTAMLNLKEYSSVVLVWRSRSQMDHPIHLHGYKMEILDIYQPLRQRDCSQAECQIPTVFDSPDDIKDLVDRRAGTAVLKDTFILPAGGAAVVMVQTAAPAVWFAHCHLSSHRDDGMAFLINVGNYTAPADPSWLPDDFPSCDHPYVQTLKPKPSCTCYRDEDSVLDQALSSDHRCSKDYLCKHKISQVANLESFTQPAGV